MLALLGLIATLAPSVITTVQAISAYLSPGAVPATSPVITALINELSAVASQVPTLTALAPVIAKAMAGESLTDADLAVMETAADAVDAQIAAAELVGNQGTI
jgi:hypothetical protein